MIHTLRLVLTFCQLYVRNLSNHNTYLVFDFYVLLTNLLVCCELFHEKSVILLTKLLYITTNKIVIRYYCIRQSIFT